MSTRPVQVDRPGRSREAKPPAYYVHLSAAPSRPSVCLSVPCGSYIEPARSNSPNGPSLHSLKYPGKKGGFVVVCRPHIGGSDKAPDKLSTDIVEFHADPALARSADRGDGSRHVARLIQCTSVEEAIRQWDSKAIKDFVAMLHLRVITFDKGDPLNPGLHILQHIAD